MMTNDGNRRIFHRDLALRDNGAITIGSYLRILAPEPVERNMQGIPLVKPFAMAVAMDKEYDPPAIPIDINIEGSNTGVAVLTNAELEVRSTTPIQTTCSGKHCDKQRHLDGASRQIEVVVVAVHQVLVHPTLRSRTVMSST